MTKPIDNCFWVLPDVLMAGEHPGGDNEEETRRRLRRFLARWQLAIRPKGRTRMKPLGRT